jgi:hypothetical protein
MNLHGTVAVTLCSSSLLDPRILDPASLTLAGANVALKGKDSWMMSYETVSSCAPNTIFPDLVAQFDAGALQLNSTDTFAILKGATHPSIGSAARVRACQVVNVVGHDEGKKNGDK